MSRKRKKYGKKIDGILLINKDIGLTSNGVLQRVLKLLDAQKGGHTGSLDPFATGMLPICLGEATKVSSFLLNSDKIYTATLSLGKATSTGDLTGDIIENREILEISEQKISSVFKKLEGKILQVPPMFSALKHKGKPLYEYARKGINIERQAREVHIYELKLIYLLGNEISFKVKCSKGTYIRTLGEETAKALGTVGHLIALHRTQVGKFCDKPMFTLSELEEQIKQNNISIETLDTALEDYNSITLTDEEVKMIKSGGMLEKNDYIDNSYVRLYNQSGQIVAMGEWHDKTQQLKAKRVFNI